MSGVDLAALALRARVAVAGPTSVTLLIRGVGRIRATAPAVLLHDRDGYPTFLCQSGSPVTPAATRESPAVVAVTGRDGTGTPITVTICGRLTRIGVEDRGGDCVDVVGLTPSSVWVEEDDPRHGHVVQHALPVDVYVAAVPDSMERCARRAAAHTTQAHQSQLREFVAARTGTSPDSIAGVCLSSATCAGADLQWVDSDGAHTLSLRFPCAARTPRELAERLRAALETGQADGAR